jgi:carboxypeptidase family protein/TonB-dependent receptor-like protein
MLMGFLFALGLPLLLAQDPAPAIRGIISDEATSEPIAGARVELLDVGRRTYSDTAGRFELSDVATGSHRLHVSRLGYTSRMLDVLLPPSGDFQIDVALTAVPAELVRVRVVDTSSRHRGTGDDATDALLPGSRLYTADDVRSQPLLAEPDFLLALAADAGVAMAPEAPTAFHVRGGSGDQNLVLLDGAPVYSPVHGSGSFSALNPDALEGVSMYAGVMPARLGGALSSVVEARSRDPDLSRLHARGSVNVTSARLTLEGPLPGSRVGFLLSGRWGTPALFAGRFEDTRLRGESRDVLAKVTTSLGGGLLEAVSLSAGDRAGFAAQFAATEPSLAPVPARHAFEWGSETQAVQWHRDLGTDASLALAWWHAGYEAEIDWVGASTPLSVASSRATDGLRGSLSLARPGRWLRIGLEAQQDRAGYVARTRGAESGSSSYALDGHIATLSAFVDERRQLADNWQLMTGARGSLLSSDAVLLEPRVALVTQLHPAVSIALGAARTFQPAQSLGNPESLVQSVFGADLPFLANEESTPIGRADQVAATITVTPRSSFRMTIDAYVKHLEGLVLVAPVTSRPFAADSIATGSGRVVGLGVGTDWRGEQLALATVLGLSRNVTRAERDVYQPGYAPELSMSSGVTYHSSERVVWRAAMTARSGRRVTRYEGPLRWESCDPLDGGCEIVGTPERASGAVGAARLPTYLRFDLGARRSWEIRMRERAPVLEGYVTVSNVLGRRNVWALLTEPGTGVTRSIPMRPFSVLAAGLDWRY